MTDRDSLLDFRLPSGKRLRDATREEVLEAAEYYGRQAREARKRCLLAKHELRRNPIS